MKLYLNSYRILTPSELFELVGKKAEDTRVALIPNAKDYYAVRAKNFKVGAVIADMDSIGLSNLTVIDLHDHSSAVVLKDTLKDFDLIWVMGGNTFCLRYEMKRSGFDQIIRELLESGIVYGGESAGALTAGNSLKGVEFVDEPEFAEEVIWEGLNLTNHFVLPHVGSADFGIGIEAAKKLHKSDPTLIELTDDQAFIINGSKNRKITTSV